MSDINYLARYSKSFNWAGLFLPKKTYRDCTSLYNFCRSVDDITDSKEDLHIKIDRLEKFRGDFERNNNNNKIISNMWDLMDEYNISELIIFDLFDGLKTDLVKRLEFKTKKSLLIYSYRVAGTVGLMMAKILKVSDLNALRGAIDLGIAMQLTNISRDVIEDANLNRFYIMNNFSKLDETIKIADMFYDSSFYALKAIPIRMRFSIIVARRVYRKIGYKVIKLRNFENYTNAGRIYVTGPEKVLETLKSIYDLLRLVMLKKEKDLTKHYHSLVMEEIDYNARF